MCVILVLFFSVSSKQRKICMVSATTIYFARYHAYKNFVDIMVAHKHRATSPICCGMMDCARHILPMVRLLMTTGGEGGLE